jgi:iron only hydrogenase large subunit-like protein
VTSAETVLIQEQSYEKLFTKLRQQDSFVILCLSPQSLASMAMFLGMSCAESFLRIAAALKNLGVYYVLDASSAGDVALVEAREEFLYR